MVLSRFGSRPGLCCRSNFFGCHYASNLQLDFGLPALFIGSSFFEKLDAILGQEKVFESPGTATGYLFGWSVDMVCYPHRLLPFYFHSQASDRSSYVVYLECLHLCGAYFCPLFTAIYLRAKERCQ